MKLSLIWLGNKKAGDIPEIVIIMQECPRLWYYKEYNEIPEAGMGENRRFDRFRQRREDNLRRHEEAEKRHDDLKKQREEFQKVHREFMQKKMELNKYHRHLKYFRPGFIIMNLAVWYFVYRFSGFRGLSIIFAIFITVGGILQILYMMSLEKRIITPISKLKSGVEEIAKGNYDVKVEGIVRNEISLLIDSFNDMAHKLLESDRLKAEYEENRKLLIANISHDLKTPIASIQGYIEAITDGTVTNTENINKYLQIIKNNTVYINKLIDDLFLFSKLDMQKLDFNFQIQNIGHFMDDLMEEFKFELEEQQCKFVYQNKLDKDYEVKLDGKRLNQAVRNIIGNAIKYGPENNLNISVELYYKEESIYIGIRDNGPGIPEDKLEHIFDRFYRVDAERTKDLISTGLGLAIARELVEAHGGKISVSSSKKEGTCFTIELPKADA
ncbi:MAG: HAMP domain-containing sensor histidine kinase [Bacillota bacterium]|nr:HAMP domain-containing sensor histidine kinase [Bacillota bacterium]